MSVLSSVLPTICGSRNALMCPSLPALQYLMTQKRFWYYRFQKRVGKGNWGHYLERYQRPRYPESTQKLLYNYSPHFLDSKEKHKWLWLLPKEIAKHTKPNDLLECWVRYRTKRKRAQHYMDVLQRLVASGGCDCSDWRFRLISAGIRKSPKRFIDLPRICYYLSMLNASSDVESLTKYLMERIHLYTPKQLSQIASAFANCKIQDRRIFAMIAQNVKCKIEDTSNEEIAVISKAFAATMIHDYSFLSFTSNEIQRRMSEADESPETIRTASQPSLKHLAVIADAFAILKFQDFSFFHLLSIIIQDMLVTHNIADPFTVTQIVESFLKVKINDIPLLECVLHHVDQYIFDYPSECLCTIGLCSAVQLPPQLDEIKQIHSKLLQHIYEHMELLDLSMIEKSCSFVKSSNIDQDLKHMYIQAFSVHLQELSDDTSTMFDVGKVMEIFWYFKVKDINSYDVLCKHLHRHLPHFEPVDYSRIIRALVKVKQSIEFTDMKAANAVTRNLLQHCDEFKDVDLLHAVNGLSEFEGLHKPYVERLRNIYKTRKIPHGCTLLL